MLQWFASLFLVFASHALAEDHSLKFGGLLDVYFAHDFYQLGNESRDFTTQAARNNEPNVNLAFIEAKFDSDRIHGRLALQAGTSVPINYGAEKWRNIQEAYAGYRLIPNWWLDAGIMLSHIGMESWISRDNPIYLRSFVAEFSPYYQAGIRNDFKISEKWAAKLLVLNGWQNITDNNDSKSIGTQITYSPNEFASLSYNTLLGNESGFRHFHDIIFKVDPIQNYSLWTQFDFGFQSTAQGRTGDWYGFALIHRYALSNAFAVSVRGERFSDPMQIIATSSQGGLNAWGASVGLDYQPEGFGIYRFETRSLWNNDAIFKDGSGYRSTNLVMVLSACLKI